MILKLLINILFSFWFAFGQRHDDACSNIRRAALEVCEENILSQQGPPGKRGALGPPGPKGDVGPPGSCNCEVSELVEILKQIPNLNNLVCTVGIKDGRVRNQDMTQSSFWPGHEAYHAKLDSTSYWHAARGRNRAGEWIQVDLRSPTRVTGVTTQGKYEAPGIALQWVSSYKILYGSSPDGLRSVRNDAGDIVFPGNTDRSTHVTNLFPQPITARFFRLVIQTFYGYPVLRMELLTC